MSSWQYKPRNEGVKPLELSHARLFPRPHDQLVELVAQQVEILIQHTGLDRNSLPSKPKDLDQKLSSTTAIEDFRENLELIITSLKFPLYDAASIKLENAKIQKEIESRTNKPEKINDCMSRERDGTATAYSERFQTLVKIAHHGDLREDQFAGCKAIFIDAENKTHTLLTKTFINYLAKGEQLGIPENRLSELLALFSRLYLPQLGDLSRHGKDNKYNWRKIINSLDPFAEKRTIQNSLRRMSRHPAIGILNYTSTLDHHYDRHLSTGKLGTLEDSSFLGTGSHNEEEEKARLKFLKAALLGLISGYAQWQFFFTVDIKKFTELSLEQFQLLVLQADRQYPPKGSIQLPPHISLLSSEGTGQFGPDQIMLCSDDAVGLLALHGSEENYPTEGDPDFGAAGFTPRNLPQVPTKDPWTKTDPPAQLAPVPRHQVPSKTSPRLSRRDGSGKRQPKQTSASKSPARGGRPNTSAPPPANLSPGAEKETRIHYLRRKAGTQGLPANLLALKEKGVCLACNSHNHWVKNCPNYPEVARMAANSTHHRDLPICKKCSMAHHTDSHHNKPKREDSSGRMFSKRSPLRPYKPGDSKHSSPTGTSRDRTPMGREPSPSPTRPPFSPKNL